MISKELLSEVLGVEVIDSDRHRYDSSTLQIIYSDDDFRYINIYELMNKCKEWIINNGYVLRICYVLENDTRELCFVEITLLKSDQYLSDYYDMDSKTEVEAIIKASEWILKELNK